MARRLLMISTDRTIFREGSPAHLRQVRYAAAWEEVHIIVFDLRSSGSPDEVVIAPNCWVYSTRSRSRWFYPLDAIRLGRFIAAWRAVTDITCQDASLTAMAGLSIARHLGRRGRPVPAVEIQIHEDIGSPNFSFRLTNRIRKALALSQIPKADRVRAVSGRIRDYVVRDLGVPEGKIEVRPIAVDVEGIRGAAVIETADLRKLYPRFQKIVLMASRLESEKNIGLALEAWALVLKQIPRAGLVIAGSGSERIRLERMARKLGIADAVVFAGQADQTAMRSYYKTADLFLNTSLFEGYGLTLVEARASGCPIVSTDVGVAREAGAEIVPYVAAEVAHAVEKRL